MNNKKIVILVVVSVLFIGLGIFWYRSKKKNETVTLPDGTVVDKQKTATLPDGKVIPISPRIPGGIGVDGNKPPMGDLANRPGVTGIKWTDPSVVRPQNLTIAKPAANNASMSAFDDLSTFDNMGSYINRRIRRVAKHNKLKKKIFACGFYEYTREPGETTSEFITSINADIAAFVSATIQAVFYTVDATKSSTFEIDDTTNLVTVYFQYYGFAKDMPIDFTAGACTVATDKVDIVNNEIPNNVVVCFIKHVKRLEGVDFSTFMASINTVISNSVSSYSPYLNCIGYVPNTPVLDSTTTHVVLYFEYLGPALTTYPAGSSLGACVLDPKIVPVKDNIIEEPPTGKI